MVKTANDKANVAYLTLSIDGDIDDARRAAIDDAVHQQGGKAVWRKSEAAACSYALLELPDPCDGAAIIGASGATAYDRPIIALAVFPTVAQAIPALLDALGGRGRAAGILRCRACDGGAVVEWDPEVTDARVVIGLVDLELERFASGRITELLSPLPPLVVARIASSGLEAPQITPQRILQLRVDRA